MKSNAYWENRANKRMAKYHKSSDITIAKISAAYDKAIEDINEDINKIFYKFQADGGLTESEARDLLNSKIPKNELDSIKGKINGIQDEDLKMYLMSQLNSEAYKARITRLEALKQSIYINTKVAADVEITRSTQLYTDSIKKAYYTNLYDIQKGIGLGFNVAQMPSETVQEILKNKWSGEHYSKRIWHNTDVLAEKLEEIVTRGLMTGKSSRRLAEELKDQTNYGKFVAERLIRTETTYVVNSAEIESYKEAKIDKFIFVATLDIRTSEICRKKDGKIIRVDEAKVGVNIPPLHPWCRSTTRAYFENMERLQRRARDPKTGKTYIMTGDITYEEWYDKFVVDKYGKEQTEAFENMIKNKSSDRKQLNKYKEVLGKESPQTLKDFQELKYNNSKDWSIKQREYSTINSISNKEWSDSYKEKVKSAYYEFRKDNVELSWHGAQRFIDRNIDKKGNVNFTQDDIVKLFNNKPNYIQEDGRLINFENSIALVRNNETNEIVSIVVRKNPKKEWIKDD